MYGKRVEKVQDATASTELTTMVVPALAKIEIQPVKCVLHQRAAAPDHAGIDFLKGHDTWVAVAIGLRADNRNHLTAVDEDGEVLLEGPYLDLLEALEVGYDLLDDQGQQLPIVRIKASDGVEYGPDDTIKDLDGSDMLARELVGVPGATAWVRYHYQGFGCIVVEQSSERPWLATIEMEASKSDGQLEVSHTSSTPTTGDAPSTTSTYKFQVPRGLFCCDRDASPRFQVSTVVTFNSASLLDLFCADPSDTSTPALVAALHRSIPEPAVQLEMSGQRARQCRDRFFFALPAGVRPRGDVVGELGATARRLDLGRRVVTALGNRWLDASKAVTEQEVPAIDAATFQLLRTRLEDFCRDELLALAEVAPSPGPGGWDAATLAQAAAAHRALRKKIAADVLATLAALRRSKLEPMKSTV